MDVEKYLRDTIEKDPTWIAAARLVEKRLVVPGNLADLIRNGWVGLVEQKDFMKFLAFTKIDAACLVNAAGVQTDGRKPRAIHIEEAVQTLGVRFSSLVLAVNITVRNILKARPAYGWKKLLETMIAEIEIGYHFGSRAGAIGMEGGMLAAFAKNAGLGLLLADNLTAYRKYMNLKGRRTRVGTQIAVELFHCEPYQVSALIVQRFGFGTEAAFGTAVGLGDLDTSHIQIEDHVLFWRAAFRWIDALHAGRNFPADVKVRNFFPALRPPREHEAQNPVLEALHAEVARVRSEGSAWTWHLPRLDQERIKKEYGLE